MRRIFLSIGSTLALMLLNLPEVVAQEVTAEEELVQMLHEARPYHAVSPTMFDRLGWELPDAGTSVKALADDAPGGAFDPRKLEDLDASKLGYQARWHEVRYELYGLEWDIPGLHMNPENPMPDMPTLVIINGGTSNWYESFVDPLNRPGVGQYLAQKIPVLLVSIPGNYRHGGWTESDYGDRRPGYLLDHDVSAEEAKVRNAIYTFQLVAVGIKKLVEEVTSGPVVLLGPATEGENQFILHGTDLKHRMQGLSLGWGSGGTAGLDIIREVRGSRTADNYLDIWELDGRGADYNAGSYLGPLNPVWNPDLSRLAIAGHWRALEHRRMPHFKHVLQSMEHAAADNLRDYVASQIHEVLEDTDLDVSEEEVIADLFATMRAPQTGYKKMIWTVSRLNTQSWDENPSEAREILVANEFRKKNPGIPIRVLLFDVPMTKYGHIERPKQLAGGLLAALRWLMQ